MGDKAAKTTVSTHSRLKAAGFDVMKNWSEIAVSTHSRLKAAGATVCDFLFGLLFQHTAA